MGYMKIPNLYKDQSVLMFRELYASEKIHGTSAAVKWDGATLSLHSGGEKRERFAAVFDLDALTDAFRERFGSKSVRIHGESYGGSMQRMRETYGDSVRFTAFEVNVDDAWLDPEKARACVESLGLEFVPMWKVTADTKEQMVAELDRLRDQPSVIAKWRGIESERISEGIVIRPVAELTRNNGARIIAKHKRAEFGETSKPRKVLDAGKAKALADAEAIADEWVTAMRLEHVIGALTVDGVEPDITKTGKVIRAMVADVLAEATDEIIDSKPARAAIGRKAGEMFRARLNSAWRSE